MKKLIALLPLLLACLLATPSQATCFYADPNPLVGTSVSPPQGRVTDIVPTSGGNVLAVTYTPFSGSPVTSNVSLSVTTATMTGSWHGASATSLTVTGPHVVSGEEVSYVNINGSYSFSTHGFLIANGSKSFDLGMTMFGGDKLGLVGHRFLALGNNSNGSLTYGIFNTQALTGQGPCTDLSTELDLGAGALFYLPREVRPQEWWEHGI